MLRLRKVNVTVGRRRVNFISDHISSHNTTWHRAVNRHSYWGNCAKFTVREVYNSEATCFAGWLCVVFILHPLHSRPAASALVLSEQLHRHDRETRRKCSTWTCFVRKVQELTNIQHSFVRRHVGFNLSTLTPRARHWLSATKARLSSLASSRATCRNKASTTPQWSDKSTVWGPVEL